MAAAETTAGDESITTTPDDNTCVKLTVRVPRGSGGTLIEEVNARVTHAVGNDIEVSERHNLQPKADGVYITVTVAISVTGSGDSRKDFVTRLTNTPCMTVESTKN